MTTVNFSSLPEPLYKGEDNTPVLFLKPYLQTLHGMDYVQASVSSHIHKAGSFVSEFGTVVSTTVAMP